MDKIVIILLIIISIFASIGLYSLIFLIISLIFFKNQSKAISYTWLNDLGCGQKWCKSDTRSLLYPSQISPNNYQKDIATYCADLIIRLDPKRTTDGNVSLPKHLTLKLKLLNKPGDPLFGILCDGNNDNTAWLIYRGTSKLQEWIQDFTYNQVPYKDWGLVHKGFWDIYINNRDKIFDALKTMKANKVIVSGHSLGGGVAILTGVDLHQSRYGYDVEIYTFASPRVGNSAYCNKVNSIGPKVYRIVNTVDIVPTLPFGAVPNFKNYNNPWFYSDCGEIHDFTNNMKSIINNHLMANYSANIP
jgi:triacylglycerol lipase